MVPPLAPCKIHSLPVQVTYHHQASSQSFSTFFPTPQQVYVHPSPGTQVDGQNEAWGQMYLKTVVKGIVMASPELHPQHPGTPDLAVYVLDPRETFLRRSRSSHARSSSMSSSLSSPMSPHAHHDVWTGKGLVSRALAEPSQGKQLITGRVIRRAEFVGVGSQGDGMSALEALVAANHNGDTEAWGIEIFVGLKSGLAHTSGSFPGPLHRSVENGSAAGPSRAIVERPSPPRHTPHHHPHHPHAHPLTAMSRGPVQRVPSSGARVPALPTPHRPVSAGSSSATTAAAPSTAKAAPLPVKTEAGPPRRGPGRPPGSKGKKNLAAAAAAAERSRLSTVDPNVPPSSDALDIPAELCAKPEAITKEQAQKLLENPAFLSMLEQLTGEPIGAAKSAPAPTKRTETAGKRAATGSGKDAPAKRPRLSGSGPKAEVKCYNCQTTKSSVWRTKSNEDGGSVRVCNACGLYYNKTRTMRPPSMWATSDDPQSEGSSRGGGFRRTLTMVAEKDAQRIASLRAQRPKAGSSTASTGPSPPVTTPATTGMTTRHQSKNVPMTSPPRGPASAPKSVRNSRYAASTAVAASSPGGWALDHHGSTPSAHEASQDHSGGLGPAPSVGTGVPPESPNTALLRILGDSIPSLAMPLSDDGAGPGAAAGGDTSGWNSTLSAFFDVDGFAMGTPGSGGVRSSPRRAGAGVSEMNVSSATRLSKEKQDADSRPFPMSSASSEDDVFSQLFQRTSSIGDLDAHSIIGSSPRHTSSPFDFSQLPPSSPPSLPSNLPHSALLLSSPGASPLDGSASGSPHSDVDARDSNASTTTNRVSPRESGLRHEISAVDDDDVEAEASSASGSSTAPQVKKEPQVPHTAMDKHDESKRELQDLLTRLAGGSMNEDLLALFNAFPAAA